MALEQAGHDRPVARAAQLDMAIGTAEDDPLGFKVAPSVPFGSLSD